MASRTWSPGSSGSFGSFVSFGSFGSFGSFSLLVLALAGCSSALECPPNGRFWDGCNWCFCRDRVVLGCTNMACVGLDPVAYRLDDKRDATIGPPHRQGIIAYRPGRGRVVDPTGWPCQMGSSWLEEGGCVRCVCANKMIKCRDSGLCLNGELLSNEVPFEEHLRPRRQTAEDGVAAAPAAVVEPVTTTAAAPAATPAAPSATPAVASATPTAPSAETTSAAVPEASASTAEAQPLALAAAIATVTAAPEGVNAGDASNTTQATPLAATTAQATVVKDRTCKSGSTWEEDCNSCWCLDNNRAACTTNFCEPPLPLGAPAAPAQTAPPGEASRTASTATAAATAGASPAGPAATPTTATSSTPEATTAVAPATSAPAATPATDPADNVSTTSATTPAATTVAAPAATAASTPAAGSRRKRRVVLLT